jgi:pimeloyl-ACP methyl ester carboxylesterase
MRVASTDGVDLELHDLGGDGPPLLVAHATGFCAGAYRPLADRLAERFHVWGIDFRAHGGSTVPASGDLTWRGMIEDVLAAVDAIDAGPVFGVGHSMGGACLLGAELVRPGALVRAWAFEPIVVSPDWGGSAAGPNHLAESARRRRPGFPSRHEALARYASRPPLGRFRADVLSAYVEHGFADGPDGGVVLRCTPEHEAQVFEADGKPERDTLGAVIVPVVVGCGERDPAPGPAAAAPGVAAALPWGELRTYAHLGHFGPLQDPDTIADDVLAFFADA